ncbi:cytidine deaminase isoform X1 [Halyomorpha halys]|uniref:cytidine deaminase isoform X1 n=1 Tax=Halyomorpha halys TaxID=286706 RepID=UPI0006D509ED|nr:uncharacterized protein LOC106686644 isoform X2 [Halyomorpha halys]
MSVGKIVQFEKLAKNIQSLIEESISMRSVAYCPYSNFQVGAALLTKKGTVFTGCNVENAAYGVTICAERTALVKAVSSQEKEFAVIAVSAEMAGGKITSPCGECRQFISEFAKNGDIEVYLTTPDKAKILKTSIYEILPLGFGF